MMARKQMDDAYIHPFNSFFESAADDYFSFGDGRDEWVVDCLFA